MASLLQKKYECTPCPPYKENENETCIQFDSQTPGHTAEETFSEHETQTAANMQEAEQGMERLPNSKSVVKLGIVKKFETSPNRIQVDREHIEADNTRTRAGREDAEKQRFIAELYKEFWSKLNRSLRALVHSEDVAEDIAHDAFVRMSTMDNPQQLEYPYAYLYRTAVNLIKDRAKAWRIREDYKLSVQQDEDYNIESKTPERYFMAREELDIAIEAIEALPPKCRRVFLLHKVENLSHKEIAEQVGVSKYTVEKHIMRAMARCQDYWGNV